MEVGKNQKRKLSSPLPEDSTNFCSPIPSKKSRPDTLKKTKVWGKTIINENEEVFFTVEDESNEETWDLKMDNGRGSDKEGITVEAIARPLFFIQFGDLISFLYDFST